VSVHPLVFVFPLLVSFAAVSDLLTMTIPNRLSIALALAFFALAPVAGLGWSDILGHMGACSAVLLCGILLFSMGWLGGGDAKLLAAASLWFGFEHLVEFLAYTAAFGGVLAAAILAYRNTPAGAFPLPGWAARLHAKGGGMPYGIAVAAGALFVYPATGWYAAFTG